MKITKQPRETMHCFTSQLFIANRESITEPRVLLFQIDDCFEKEFHCFLELEPPVEGGWMCHAVNNSI